MASNDVQDVVEEHSPFTVCAMNPKEWPRGPKLDSMVLVNGNHECRIVANGAVAAPPTDLTVSEMYRCAQDLSPACPFVAVRGFLSLVQKGARGGVLVYSLIPPAYFPQKHCWKVTAVVKPRSEHNECSVCQGE